MEGIIAELLRYSFRDISTFDELTHEERAIIGDEDNFYKIKEWIKEHA